MLELLIFPNVLLELIKDHFQKKILNISYQSRDLYVPYLQFQVILSVLKLPLHRCSGNRNNENRINQRIPICCCGDVTLSRLLNSTAWYSLCQGVLGDI